MKITVYTYCSYKFSPVGFKLGVFQLDTESINEEFVTPETSNISPFVRNCFIEGVIQKAIGRIPETNEYIILRKGLECDYVNEDGMPAKKYGNFAFLTTELSIYNCIGNLYDRSAEQLSKAMNTFLIPDSNAGETAIKINIKKFKDFILENGPNPSNLTAEERFYITSDSDSNTVIQTLSARFPDYEVSGTNGERNFYKLKKKSQTEQSTNEALILQIVYYFKKHPIIAALVTLILVLICFLQDCFCK